MIILFVEILYSRKSIYLFKSIQKVDKSIIIESDYKSLRLVLILILAIGLPVIIYTHKFHFVVIYSIRDLKSLTSFFYYYSRTIGHYLFISKFIGLCYILLERFKSINKCLTSYSRKQVNSSLRNYTHRNCFK